MKNSLNKNNWIIIVALCLLFLLSYKAIEEDTCIQLDIKSFKVGTCIDN